MRLLLASVATLAAVALAVPAFAQETAPTSPTPTPTTTSKPKPGTAAYCNTLKSATSKSACLKRVHAQAATPKPPGATTTHKKAKKLEAPKTDTAASAAPAAAPSSAPTPPQTINVPPLPQKTI